MWFINYVFLVSVQEVENFYVSLRNNFCASVFILLYCRSMVICFQLIKTALFCWIAARLTTLKSVICLSASDLKRTTKLSTSDVELLLKTVAKAVPRPPMETALNMYGGSCHGNYQIHRLSLGCPRLDSFLQGGILLRGITEITGESAAGKTQLCIQLCLSVQLPKELGGLAGGTCSE